MHSAMQPDVDLRADVRVRSILVIDDDQSFRILVRTLLVRAGYEVYEAPDGLTGLRLAVKNAVDLIITDIIMPEHEGIETIRNVRLFSPRLKILAMSGVMARHDYLALAERLGANATLEKALIPELLITTVATLLKKIE